MLARWSGPAIWSNASTTTGRIVAYQKSLARFAISLSMESASDRWIAHGEGSEEGRYGEIWGDTSDRWIAHGSSSGDLTGSRTAGDALLLGAGDALKVAPIVTFSR